MDEKVLQEVNVKLELLADSFQKVLYEDDETFLENMKSKNLAGDDINRYKHWEWTQGVGLFGYWKLFTFTKEEKYLETLKAYYDKQLEIGLPHMNVNTVTPLLAMSYLAEYTGEAKYMRVCEENAKWIMEHFPRTVEQGFQHMTSDSENKGELWDDTLFMTVLFLANMGRILHRREYLEEAEYQFMLHVKYLTDRDTGLWYHGWTFEERHNFAKALWGRGNCWITAAIPIFLEIDTQCPPSVSRFLKETLKRQVESLKEYQDPTGMWHTLVDDAGSYVETSATCGFAFGILQAIQMHVVDESYYEIAKKALHSVLKYIREDGVVDQVSYGTPMGRESKDFYKQIEIKSMPYGQALAMLLLIQSRIMAENM